MKSIIVYKSKTGFTKKYAKWVCEEIPCDFKEFRSVNKEMLASYDIIIFGTYIRVGSFHGWKRMRKMVGEGNCKKLLLFVTGATPATEEKQIDMTWKRNIPEEMLDTLPHYYMQSGLNYDRMTVLDRVLMKGLVVSMNLKRNKTKEDYEMIKRISYSFDLSSKDYIKPLVDYFKSLS